mmetsp:Transcript_168079/g.539756  ORF Transcript_168079/g.539756 Transcript_168079/m.539756 type:complete len:414 (+) Transcript_168079:145-1386(+)
MGTFSGGSSSSTSGGIPKSAHTEVGTSGRLLSACAGSVAVALTVTPLDVAKVRMQAAVAIVRKPVSAVGWEASLAACHNCPVFFCSNGIMEHCFDKREAAWSHCFNNQQLMGNAASTPTLRAQRGLVRVLRNIVAEGGVAGLYAGLPATLLIAVPNNVLYFATYEALRDRLQRFALPGLVAASVPGIAGGGARMVAACAVAPLEVVRIRMQAGRFADGGGSMPRAHQGVGTMLAEIVRSQGPRALFLGLGSTLWRDVPFSALYWIGVERIREAVLRRGWWEKSPVQGPLVAGFAGVLAGGAAAFGTTPFDVAKTRQQLDRTATAGSGKGLWATLAHVVREEGVAGLFTGSLPRVGRVGPACAIMLGSYEFTKVLWTRTHETAVDPLAHLRLAPLFAFSAITAERPGTMPRVST